MHKHHDHHHAPHEHGRHGHRAHHPEPEEQDEPGHHPHPHGGGRFGGPQGERGGRAKRGEARYLLLDVLRDSPKHGYEIIKALEERSGGQYIPSPGTVYPTLQFLEEAGLIRAEQQNERRVYELTETGKAEIEARAVEIAAFWSRQQGPVGSPLSQTEMGFLREEVENLIRTVRGGIRTILEGNDPETIRRIRQTIEQCRSEVRNLLAETQSKNETPKEDAAQHSTT